MQKLIRPLSVLTIFILFAVFLIDQRLGADVINPTNTAWLFEGGDWSQHQLGWEFFRTSDWQFPLTQIDGFFHPLPTNLGYTDSIPLLAFFFKLFNWILPVEFQYLGPVMLVNLTLQGVFAYKIARNFKYSVISSILWGGLLMLSPVLLHRFGHTALTTHWLFLYAWVQYQHRTPAPQTFIPIFISLFIHPYLTVMLIVTKLFDWLRTSPTTLIRNLLITIASSLIIWWALGYFATPSDQLFNDVGHYDTFLSGFIFGPPTLTDTLDRFLPYPIELPFDGPAEGPGYLGLGIISALFITLASLRTPKIPQKVPFYIIDYSLIILGVGIFASQLATLKWTLAQYPLFPNLLSSFRTNGRFVWVIWYFIAFFLIKYFPKKRITSSLLLLFFSLQLLDLQPILDFNMKPEQRIYSTALYQEVDNALAVTPAQTIVMHPPYQRNYASIEDYVLFSLAAARQEKNITVGYLARYDKQKIRQLRQDYQLDLLTGELEPNTTYVSSNTYWKELVSAYDKNPESLSGMCFGPYLSITSHQ